MEDLILIKAIIKNDKSAFDSLFKKYYDPLLGYIRTFTKDLQIAEDIVQQVFVDLWTERHSIKIEKSVKGFLYTVVYRRYLDHYRNLKRKNSFFDELREKALRDSIVADKESVDNRIKRLKAIIETLPPGCKEVLLLSKMSGLKYKEISKLLNISQKTVETQMRTAYIKIRKGFENDSLFMFFLNGHLPDHKSFGLNSLIKT